LGERETDRGKNEGFKPEIIGKRPMDAKLRAEHNSSGFDLILEQQANGLGEFTPAQAAMSGSIWRKSVSP